jgi:hypothetical protein
LDAYYGGPAVAPENMAWDVSDYKLENLGVDIADPGIDWDAIARMIAEKEAAAKETEESETIVVTIPSVSDRLRELADELEGT